LLQHSKISAVGCKCPLWGRYQKPSTVVSSQSRVAAQAPKLESRIMWYELSDYK
jgi:hypothetical protein